ncbi:hypothetical protein D3C81_1739560 [compost metagenome]
MGFELLIQYATFLPVQAEVDISLFKSQSAEQALQQCRFAGAVAPEQRHALAFTNLKAHPFKQGNAVPFFFKVLHFYYGHL